MKDWIGPHQTPTCPHCGDEPEDNRADHVYEYTENGQNGDIECQCGKTYRCMVIVEYWHYSQEKQCNQT